MKKQTLILTSLLTLIAAPVLAQTQPKATPSPSAASLQSKYLEALEASANENYCIAPEKIQSPRGGTAFVGLTMKAPLPKDGGKVSKKRQSLENLVAMGKAVRGKCDAEI